MKVEIEKFVSAFNVKVDTITWGLKEYTLDKTINLKEDYTYYIFRTEEKAWIRHLGKLTKGEKQWVIEQDSK